MMNTLPSKKYFTKTFLLVFSIAMLSNGTKIYASEEAPPVLTVEKFMDNLKRSSGSSWYSMRKRKIQLERKKVYLQK
jgi:hypothetical protein